MTPRQSRRDQRSQWTRRFRRTRRWPAVVLAAGLLGTGIAAIATEPTWAIWKDAEIGTPTLQAGTVSPATGLSCSGSLAAVTYSWGNPTGGVNRINWAWTYAGLLGSMNGTVDAGATSHRITTLIGLNQVFTLRATGPGVWTSQRWTATVTSVLGAVTCTIAGPLP